MGKKGPGMGNVQERPLVKTFFSSFQCNQTIVLICCYGSFHDRKNTLLTVFVAVVTKADCLLCENFRNFVCMILRGILTIET